MIKVFVCKHFLISRLVIDTLDGVDPDRRCFRLVGGILVERKVGEVAPALSNNRDKVGHLFLLDNSIRHTELWLTQSAPILSMDGYT